MPDAVVVATARSPIGRAVKGSLKKTMCVGGDQGMDMVIERLG